MNTVNEVSGQEKAKIDFKMWSPTGTLRKNRNTKSNPALSRSFHSEINSSLPFNDIVLARETIGKGKKGKFKNPFKKKIDIDAEVNKLLIDNGADIEE